MCGAQVGARGSTTRTSGTSLFTGAHSTAKVGSLAGVCSSPILGELFPPSSLPLASGSSTRRGLPESISSYFWPLLPGIRGVHLDGEHKSLVPHGVFVERTLTVGQQCCFPHVARALFATHQSAPPTFSLPQRMPPSMGFHNPWLLPHHKLRISTDDQLLDSRFCHNPEPDKEPLILCSIVGSPLPGKMHLNEVLEVLPSGSNKKHASYCTL